MDGEDRKKVKRGRSRKVTSIGASKRTRRRTKQQKRTKKPYRGQGR